MAKFPYVYAGRQTFESDFKISKRLSDNTKGGYVERSGYSNLLGFNALPPGHITHNNNFVTFIP